MTQLLKSTHAANTRERWHSCWQARSLRIEGVPVRVVRDTTSSQESKANQAISISSPVHCLSQIGSHGNRLEAWRSWCSKQDTGVAIVSRNASIRSPSLRSRRTPSRKGCPRALQNSRSSSAEECSRLTVNYQQEGVEASSRLRA